MNTLPVRLRQIFWTASVALVTTLTPNASHADSARKDGYGCINAFGIEKCGYGCAHGFGQLECGSRVGESCLAAFGKVVCGYNCVAKYGDIVCDSFPSDDLSIRVKPNRKYQKIMQGQRQKDRPIQNKNVIACPDKKAPLNACDAFISEIVLEPMHMGCTASGSHVWMCKGNQTKPPFPVIVCSSWESESCVKMSESW